MAVYKMDSSYTCATTQHRFEVVNGKGYFAIVGVSPYKHHSFIGSRAFVRY